MALILSLETSTDVCSAAIHRDGTLLVQQKVSQPQAHASKLAPLIQQLFLRSGVKPADLQAVAVASGPGSYTGLRIGTSTAKGLCFALNIPLLSVPTLVVLAHQVAGTTDALLCPMIDARRMEVYCEVFNNALATISPLEAKVIDKDSFKELLDKQKLLLFGNGSSKCKDVIHHENAIFLEDITPDASSLGSIASKKFLDGDFEDLSEFAPLYLKEFVAKPARPLL